MKDLYNWKLRLSNKLDIKTVIVFWAVSIFNLIADFVIYTIVPADEIGYGKSGTIEIGLERVFLAGIVLIPICIFFTISMIGDRLLVKRQSKDLKNGSNVMDDAQKINYRKRNIIRLTFFLIMTFLSLPWVFAIVGVRMSDVSGLSLIFKDVHVGTHHGWDAYLLGSMALLASCSLDGEYYIKSRVSRSLIAAFIVFLSLFAFFAGMEDFLNEQLNTAPLLPFFRSFYWSIFFYPTFGMFSILALFFFYFVIYNHKNDLHPNNPS